MVVQSDALNPTRLPLATLQANTQLLGDALRSPVRAHTGEDDASEAPRLEGCANERSGRLRADALAMVLLESRGFTEKDFSRFHPGGALGRALLTKVSDIMRSGDDLASISPTATVQDALSAMSEARSGACIIAANDGTLAFTWTETGARRSSNGSATYTEDTATWRGTFRTDVARSSGTSSLARR